MSKKTTILTGLLLGGAALLVWLLSSAGNRRTEAAFHTERGQVFGTYYNIQYRSTDTLHAVIMDAFARLDGSLSMFNDTSVISRINRNEPVLVDSLFIRVWHTAEAVSTTGGGAFDMTVAPLVHAWGFGKSTSYGSHAPMTEAQLDSLRALVGYRKVRLTADGRIEKDDPRITLDASAIAKGYACDLVAEALAEAGCTDLLVDIGGEVVARGHNSRGEAWRVGITRPQDDPDGTHNDIQEIITTEHIDMATSGNYRQFYYDGDQRRSHTIDPRTGFPVSHNLLSATVVASSCMRADALATACMVLGTDSALALIDATPDAACYLIEAVGDTLRVRTSARWNDFCAR